MNAQDIENRDFSLAQVFYSDPWRVEKFIVPSHKSGEATRQAETYAATHYGRDYTRVLVYPRTYVKQARALLAQGRAA